jgi:hypothetical protein
LLSGQQALGRMCRVPSMHAPSVHSEYREWPTVRPRQRGADHGKL